MAPVAEPKMLPLFELNLNAAESPSINTTQAASLPTGASLVIRCMTVGEGFDEGTLSLEREGKLLPSTRLSIDSFDETVDMGVYECAAKRTDGRLHRRKLRLKHKTSVPDQYTKCAVNHCSNGGECVLGEDNINLCICPQGYVGNTCEDVMIRDYIVTGATVGMAAGTTINVILMAFLLAFIFLWYRERNKRRGLEDEKKMPMFCEENETSPFNHEFAMPYFDSGPSETRKAKEKRSLFDTKQMSEPLANNGTIERINAIKERVAGVGTSSQYAKGGPS